MGVKRNRVMCVVWTAILDYYEVRVCDIPCTFMRYAMQNGFTETTVTIYISGCNLECTGLPNVICGLFSRTRGINE